MPKVDHNEIVMRLIGRGLASDLAQRIAAKCPDLPSLMVLSQSQLAEIFGDPETELISRALKRKEIPSSIVFKLVQECDWKCCLCWNIDKESPVVIHHIEEHSQTLDDRYENLSLLCMDHHAKAHSRWEISRSPWPPELIRLRKSEWVKAIADFKAGLRKGPGREENWFVTFQPAPPPPPDIFLGRDDLIESLAQSILAPRTKGLALVGMAGVGKTSLALKLAERCSAHFSGGIFWADFSDESGDPLPVLRTWLEYCGAAGNHPTDAQAAASILKATLQKHASRQGNCLFVIDDTREAWLDKLPLLLDIIPDSSPFILTTRDKTVPVAIGISAHAIEPLSNDWAFKLLRQEARSPLIDSETANAVSLTRLLGGLPLALTLVGKQIALNSSKPGYSLERVRAQIERFSEDALSFPGHRGLAASFALSYESLEAESKRLFRWLGAFAGGAFRLRNLAQVTDTDISDAENCYDRMVAISLVNWGIEPGIYRIHPLLHQYARYLLGGNFNGAEFLEGRRLHLEYYASLVESIAESRPQNHDEIQAEFSNILIAIDSAYEMSRWQVVSDFVINLWTYTGFLYMRGYEQQSINLLEKAVFASRQIPDSEMEAAHLGNLGSAKARLGRLSEAKGSFEQACDIAEKAGKEYDVPVFLHNIGNVLKDMGRSAEAITFLLKAIEKAQATGNVSVLRDAFGTLGSLYRGCGDLDRAAHFYNGALKLSIITNDRLGEGNSLSNLGLVYLDAGAVEEGERCIKKALSIAREIGDKHGQANRLGHLGGIMLKSAMAAEDMVDRIVGLGQARDYLYQALQITREVGDRIHEEVWLGNLGNLAMVAGQTEKAREYLLEALQLARETGHKDSEGLWLFNLGVLYRDTGNLDNARKHISEAVSIFRAIKSGKTAEAEALLKKLSAA